MELIKTSKFIKSLFEDDISEGIMEFEDIDFSKETKLLFNTFISNKILKIDYETINDFLIKFDILYKVNFFNTFKQPMIQEYFCQQLNFLLLIDFILSFFRINNKAFDVKKINTSFIFDFFVKLGEFYSFMNYLDVDNHFVDYLKYMITLYTLQLQRDVIENNFHYDIEILDNFFANEIMPKVFEEIKYKNMNDFLSKIERFDKIFEKELKEYNPNINYNTDVFKFSDNIFYLNYNWNQEPSIKVKTTEVEIMNPTPPPAINYNNMDNDLESENDSDYYSDDDYYGGQSSRNKWTPTIKKKIPNIEENDPNYKSYRNSFIFKHYQNLHNDYNNLLKEVRMLCSCIRIKDYSDFLQHNNTKDIVRVKTIIGINLDFKSLDKNIVENVYNIACEYGHLEIVKNYIAFKNGDIDLTSNIIEKAAASPNREILKFLKESSSKYKKLNNMFDIRKDSSFYEPKIRFN